MARGWESKAIEAQQEMRGSARKGAAAPLSADERARLDRRRTLELARARTLADLQAATSAGHRRMLERALQDLDEELSRTEERRTPARA
jgi:hypothetical protein